MNTLHCHETAHGTGRDRCEALLRGISRNRYERTGRSQN